MKIAIIGGGPAGYVGAIRAAQLGAEVVLVEKSVLGGTCLNVGCIPTKALLASAEICQKVKEAGQFGIQAELRGFDWPAIQKRKERVVRKATAGVASLMKARKVEVVYGRAKLIGDKTVVVETDGKPSAEVKADSILIASGSEPVKLTIPGADLPGVIDSTGALDLSEVPNRLLIVGGGVIGCEMAEIFSAFGSKVTIVEMMSQIIPGEDPEAASLLHRSLIKKGVEVHLEAKVSEFRQSDSGIQCQIQDKEGQQKAIEADKVLVAVGRRPAVAGLGLDECGLTLERGFIKVGPTMATSRPYIYAAGDCTGGWLLAHVASREAEVAVENMLGNPVKMDYRSVPRCVYTHPEIASVGVLERPANAGEVLVGKFPFSASAKASCLGELEGFVKIVSDRDSRQVLGGVIAGPSATELIAEISLAVSARARLDDIIHTIHAHPTLHESVAEAALGGLGRAIHLP
jgi:dihydrolipoamide dehydrogenase